MRLHTIRKIALLSILGAILPITAAHGQWVHVAPPPPVVERHAPPPGRGYTWVAGYHRWDGHRYIWVGGRWVVPPRPRAIWIPGHWVDSPRGWFWRPGHWRG
jgi:hypothetical protein